MPETMTRTWQEAPEITIATPLGPARLVATSAGTVYVDANSNHAPGLTVRGVTYGVSAYLVFAGGTEWVLSSTKPNPYTSRRWDGSPKSFEPASASARTAIERAIVTTVRDILARPEGVALLERAEAVALNNALLDATEAHVKALRVLADAEARLGAIEARLAALPPGAREEA